MLPAVSALRRELSLFRAPTPPHAEVGTAVTIPAPAAALSTSHLDLVLAAAIAGLGIAGLPSFVLEAPLRDGRLERVLPEWRGSTLTLYAAVPSRRHLPARTRAFVDFLIATFGGRDVDPWLAS